MDFQFQGVIPSSKSLYNRALICSSYQPRLRVMGTSDCEDVTLMKRACADLSAASFQCGSAGTVLRFLALRLSRLPGEHRLVASERLLSRPQQELMTTLSLLGCTIHSEKGSWHLHSQGWPKQLHEIPIDTTRSSQFASALLLNSWGLENPLRVNLHGQTVSEGYFDMTLKLLRLLGMAVKRDGALVEIPAHSQITATEFQVESDASSMFAVAAFAAYGGRATFYECPRHSLQPDSTFLDLLTRMGAQVERVANTVTVRRSQCLHGIEADLGDRPDLFPVLAALASLATTPSRLYGAHHLIHKESNRIAKMAELFSLIGVKHKVLADGLEVTPQASPQLTRTVFDPDQDHRMAFAAALLWTKHRGLHLTDTRVVNKSFPEFWQCVGISPKEIEA